MKLKINFIVGAALALLILATGSLQAQRNVVDVFTITGSALEEQGECHGWSN